MWGHELNDEKDVWNVFYCYLTGKPNKKGIKVLGFQMCSV